MSRTYPEQRVLFQTYLGLPDSVPADIEDELHHVSLRRGHVTAQEISRVKKLLGESASKIPFFIRWGPAFENLYIFPGKSPVVLNKYSDLIVPDRQELSKVFGARLPWHDLDADEIEKLRPLLKSADVWRAESLLLSKRVKEKSEYIGKLVRNLQYEEILKTKSLYFCR